MRCQTRPCPGSEPGGACANEAQCSLAAAQAALTRGDRTQHQRPGDLWLVTTLSSPGGDTELEQHREPVCPTKSAPVAQRDGVKTAAGGFLR